MKYPFFKVTGYLVLLLLSGRGVLAQDAQLSLQGEKAEYLLGEPVVVLVTLTNSGSAALRVCPEFGPETDIYHYEITTPGGKKVPFSPFYVAEIDERMDISAGGSVGGPARIYFSSQGYTFDKPGEYKLVVRLGKAESAPLSIRIRAPQNAEEREQSSSIIDHPEVGVFLMLEGGDEFKDAQKQIGVLTQKYPHALLTSYVRYAVAKNQSVPARNFVTKKPRAANLDRAIGILDSLRGIDLPMSYRSKIHETLSASLERMGKKPEAIKVLEEFQRELRDHQNRRFFERRIDSMMDRLK